MDVLLLVAYIALGYWACGKTIYANKIRIGTMKDLALNRMVAGFILGWILIPIALIKMFFHK